MSEDLVMICLVSDQAIPNLQAVLDDSLKIKDVVLLTSGRMQKQANRLKSVFERNDRKCRIEAVEYPYDANAIHGLVKAILKKYEAGQCIVNVTGGTKLMSIAAFDAAKEAGVQTLYVQQDTGTGQWLASNKPCFSLDARLDCEAILTAYGFDIVNHSNDLQCSLRVLADQLVKIPAGEKSLIKSLNKVTYLEPKRRPKKNKKSAPTVLVSFDDKLEDITPEEKVKVKDFLKKVNDDKIGLVHKITCDEVSFCTEYARAFLCGEWLEVAAENSFKRLADKFRLVDIRRGVNIKSVGENVKNELDVIFVQGDRLHIVECKTANYGKDHSPNSSDLIYKLADQQKYGGLKTQRLLISYNSLKGAAIDRAREKDITVLQGDELLDLDNALANWLGPEK